MNSTEKSGLTGRLDALYEFDREPVTENKLQGAGNFIGMYAGEHVAGTEFIIGPLFVAHGVSAPDLFLGLLAGNVLAVLSWVFLCTPIAIRTRLTLYWQLRKICGPYLTAVYSSNLVLSTLIQKLRPTQSDTSNLDTSLPCSQQNRL